MFIQSFTFRESLTCRFLFLFALLVFSAGATVAQTTEFTYQGSLKDGGNPATGNYDFEFLLFDSLAGSTQLGLTLTQNSVAVASGVFSVRLDFGNQFPGANRFLEIHVRQTGGGAFTPLTPRQLVNSAPYSLQSLNATSATNATQLNGQPPAFYQNAGNLSSGTLPAARLPNPLTLSGTSVAHIIKGDNASTGVFARGVHGAATGASGATIGVLGESASTSGTGVAGLADANTGTTSGVSGQADSASGRGVYGLASANAGSNYGGWFETNSTFGTGVLGQSTAATGTSFGVRGLSAGTAGRGVYGQASAVTGTTYGVYGQASSTSGRAVYGVATAASGTTYGGYFEVTSASGYGVFALATSTTGATRAGQFVSHAENGRGLYAEATDFLGPNYGVYGQSALGSYGVYSSSDLGAAGTKSFRIDHPDDPANKYLLHYASESPEVINFYRGTVVLDRAGEAVVELPRYFAKINKSPSYQLTAIGAPMPGLHVAEEIDAATLIAGATAGPGQTAPVCSFRIAGGAPRGKVSWRVEAVRNDRWIQKRAAPVEIDKQGIERGKYQRPELYGQPAAMGMNYDAATERPEPRRP